jgi:hypothetical protein
MTSISEVAAALELAWATAHPSRQAAAVNEVLRDLHTTTKRLEPPPAIYLAWVASAR